MLVSFKTETTNFVYTWEGGQFLFNSAVLCQEMIRCFCQCHSIFIFMLNSCVQLLLSKSICLVVLSVKISQIGKL